MLSGTEPSYQRYRAPSANDTSLVVPPLDLLVPPDATPSPTYSAMDVQIGDVSLPELRTAARQELLLAAKSYTASYRDLPSLPDADAPLYLTGHQAELFHPGVWFKNFMLSVMAAKRGAVGIHLVIDSDTVHAASVRVPTGSVASPRIESVPFDAMSTVMPVEERRVVDAEVFRTFDKRVRQAIAPFVADPMVNRFWPMVLKAAERTGGNVGLSIAQARHQLEAEWSAATLEVPMSHCCELPSFHRFSATLLADAARVRDAYNRSLAAYRKAHRLRSDAQPMPDLVEDNEWVETPFWVWSANHPVRKPLYARRQAGELALTDRAEWTTRLDMPAERTHEVLAEQLSQLTASGVKIRTRALTTTLFARLVMSDLFLHGIGGAKYDEVTDDLARRLWGAPPPPYMTLSATLRLPIEHQHVGMSELRHVRQQLRDCHWHPERMLDGEVSEAIALARTHKQQWIAKPMTPENPFERHQAIEAANATMRGALARRQAELELDLQRLSNLARASAVLESREYAFCLFPEQNLRERILALVEKE